MHINIHADITSARRLLQKTRDEVHKQLPRAINKTADFAKITSSRQIGDDYGVKVGSVKGGFSIDRASSAKLYAVLTATGKKLNWINFGARQVAAGVTVRDRRGRKLIKNAFIARMPNGVKLVMRRADGSRHVSRKVKKKGPELHIVAMSGPSIPNMFNVSIREDHLDSIMRERLVIELKEAIRSAEFRRGRR